MVAIHALNLSSGSCRLNYDTTFLAVDLLFHDIPYNLQTFLFNYNVRCSILRIAIIMILLRTILHKRECCEA